MNKLHNSLMKLFAVTWAIFVLLLVADYLYLLIWQGEARNAILPATAVCFLLALICNSMRKGR